jgi:hypothetical protein
MPLSSAQFHPNSSARKTVYSATVTRSCRFGYTPSARPARDAPTAGAYGDVSAVAVLGLRRRKGAADGSRRCARRRLKKRKRMR